MYSVIHKKEMASTGVAKAFLCSQDGTYNFPLMPKLTTIGRENCDIIIMVINNLESFMLKMKLKSSIIWTEIQQNMKIMSRHKKSKWKFLTYTVLLSLLDLTVHRLLNNMMLVQLSCSQGAVCLS